MLRILKGCALSVVVALMLAREENLGAQGAEWIARVTGYSDKPVNQALLFLESNGIVSRNGRYLWALTGQFKQLPFEVCGEGVGKFPTPSSSSGRHINSIKYGESSSSESENLRVEILEVCDELKIREPARSQIAARADVTIEEIRAHVRQAPKIGAAIWRILNGWPVEDDQEGEDRRKYITGRFSDFISH
jgi:hypothetical protein